MNGDLDGTGGGSELDGGITITELRSVAQEVLPQHREILSLSVLEHVLIKAGKRARQQRLCPPAVEYALGRLVDRRFAQEAILSVLERQRDQCDATPTLRRRLVVACIRGEVFERGEQKGTKTPARRVGVFDRLLFHETGEKGLREVFRIFRSFAPASQERVERIPVGFAKRGQRVPGRAGRR